MPTYCCVIDYTTAYPSVHRERLALILKDNNINGKMWNLLRENSKRVRIRVLHSLIPASSEEPISRGLPEGSRLSPTLFGIFAAELITELRVKFPQLNFPEITSMDDLNWIGAILYVDDLVLIATSAQQLHDMINACQDWCERSRMQINTDKTKIMAFYEATRTSRNPATFSVTSRFPLSRPATQTHLKEPDTFIYLGLKLDPVLTMDPATQHIKKKINWSYLTIAAVAHSIRYDNSLRSRTTRSSPLVLFRLWQACVLPFATQNLRYLRTPAQLQTIQTALTNSLQ